VSRVASRSQPRQIKGRRKTCQTDESPRWSRTGRGCGAVSRAAEKLNRAADRMAEAAMRLSAALASQIVVVLLTRLRLAPAMARNAATAGEVSSWTTLQGTCHRVIEGPRDVGATVSKFDSRAGRRRVERASRAQKTIIPVRLGSAVGARREKKRAG